MRRYKFSRTLSAFEAMQLERAIEPNGGYLILDTYSVTGAVAHAEDIEPILQQMSDIRVSELACEGTPVPIGTEVAYRERAAMATNWSQR
ncbi:MAG: hypothetical protein ACRD3P_11905 [Terriglobales bacterium]